MEIIKHIVNCIFYIVFFKKKRKSRIKLNSFYTSFKKAMFWLLFWCLDKTVSHHYRSSCPEVFCKKGVLRNLAKLTGKHLYRDSFLIKRLFFNFIKKESLAQVLFCEFCEISKNSFFYGTPQVAAFKMIVFKKIRDSLTNFTFSF